MFSGVISSEGRRLGEGAARRLAQTGRYEIGPGLTDTEIARIERDYQFEFAEDHRAFLARVSHFCGLDRVPGRGFNAGLLGAR